VLSQGCFGGGSDGEATIQRRLYETQETPIATMSRPQFEQDVLESNLALSKTEVARALHPCLKRPRRKEGRAALKDKDPDALEDRERLALEDFVSMPPPKRLRFIPDIKCLTNFGGLQQQQQQRSCRHTREHERRGLHKCQHWRCCTSICRSQPRQTQHTSQRTLLNSTTSWTF